MSASAKLWDQLTEAGQTIGDLPGEGEDTAPWYVRIMLGIAGLIAAGFLLGFVGVAFAFIIKSDFASMVTGLAIIAGAFFLFTAFRRSDFGTMFALAASITGQCLFLAGLLQLFHFSSSDSAPWVLVMLVEAALAFLMPNFIHCMLTAAVAGFAMAYALSLNGIGNLSGGYLAAMVSCLWLNEVRWARLHSRLEPIAWGLSIVLVEIEGAGLFSHSGALFSVSHAPLVSAKVGEALLVLALLASVWALLRRARWDISRTFLALAATILIAAASFKAPGVACGLLLVLLGHSNGNRVLAGLGIAALLLYVSGYYYLLNETLLFKSGVLLATGVVLLAVRWLALAHLFPRDTVKEPVNA